MAKKKVTDERQIEIADYEIAKADALIQFYTDHGLSARKISKLETKKAKFQEKKAKY